MEAAEALTELHRGNLRYVKERYATTDIGAARRREVAKGQHPFAVILGCSDSRVPPEIVFDQGLGDLFVVRTAGQAVDDIVIGSIEYAVAELGVRLIVVLGHEDCGAVKAALSPLPPPGRIAAVTAAICPAVQMAAAECGDLLTNAIVDNVCFGVARLASSPLLRTAMPVSGLEIVGAVYRLGDGRVFFL